MRESGSVVGWLGEIAQSLYADTFVLAMDLIHRSCDHFVCMARDEGLRVPVTTSNNYRTAIQQLGAVCMYVDEKLTETHPASSRWYERISAGTMTTEGTAWLERELVRYLGGSLYLPNAYTCAFSLWALCEAMPLVLSPSLYPRLSAYPQAWMDAIEAREGRDRRDAREGKNVSVRVLFDGMAGELAKRGEGATCARVMLRLASKRADFHAILRGGRGRGRRIGLTSMLSATF
jgi:hypothetical protein